MTLITFICNITHPYIQSLNCRFQLISETLKVVIPDTACVRLKRYGRKQREALQYGAIETVGHLQTSQYNIMVNEATKCLKIIT
jgi:hypothetical protein